MSKIYYDPSLPGSYGGVEALNRQVKYGKKEVKNWLEKQDAYTKHKPIRRKFTRRKILVGRLNQQFQADLNDMQSIAKYNNGYRYLLTVIDVLSRYAWALPLKNKTGKSLVEAFGKIFQERKPEKLQTDKGSEFLNAQFQKFLSDNDVEHFSTENDDIKACMVERFNRTLKSKMWRYFTKNATYKYVDVLQKFIASYNHTYHRGIKGKPAEITQTEALREMHKIRTRRQHLHVGNSVRISKTAMVFRKGYVGNWSEEIFTISKVHSTHPTTYSIKDYDDEIIKGRFYSQELQKVAPKDVYKIENVVRCTKTRCLVKWLGYPSSFNSWVAKKDIVKYRNK